MFTLDLFRRLGQIKRAGLVKQARRGDHLLVRDDVLKKLSNLHRTRRPKA